MRIHTSLTESEIRSIALSVPRVTIAHSAKHGSRKRTGAVEIRLHGSSPRNTQANDGKAATWDEWGVFISRVFESDPEAIVGQYQTVDMFEEVTRYRFDSEFMPTPGHAHRWNYAYPFVFDCKCGASMSTAPFRVSAS